VSDAQLVEMHKQAQAALVYGVTPYALRVQIDLEREICRSIDLDIISERDVLEYLLDQLHSMAQISAPRLVVYDGVPPSPLE